MRIREALGGLFVRGRPSKPARHELSNISAVSIGCGHMDRSFCYSFWIRREQNKWLFDTDCFTNGHKTETVFENREVSGKDIDALFEIIERNNLIAYAENYKKPKASHFEILDATTYSFCLTFSDGCRYPTCSCQNELEEFFYRLAENAD